MITKKHYSFCAAIVGLANVFILQSAIAASLTYNPVLDKEVVSEAKEAANISGGHIDASISQYTYQGTRHWIFPSAPDPAGGISVFYEFSTGLINNPLIPVVNSGREDTLVVPPDNPNNSDTGGYKWITNTYQDSTGVLAFVHAEHVLQPPNGTKGPGNSRIGIAWADGAPTNGSAPVFTYLGHVIKPNTDPYHFNVQGTPYLIHNDNGTDYFYIYFHDKSSNLNGWGHIAVARAPVAQVMNDAKNGVKTQWYKYFQGNWSKPGYGGLSSPVGGIGRIVMHSDAAKSTYNGRYYLAGYYQSNNWKNGQPGKVIVYESCDAINWSEVETVGESTDPNRLIQYVSITDNTGTDNGSFGNKMRIFASIRPLGNKDPATTAEKSRQSIMRYTLTANNVGC